MPNKLKQLWQAGTPTINGWLAVPSGFSAEVMAKAGWDSVTVDMQHGVQDYQSMVQCFQGMQGSPVLPMVRVPWNEPGIVGKVLDAGAYGVICPMINTKAEAEAFVSYVRYPPHGKRSNGPIRAGIYGQGTSYQATANEEILCMPMIETEQAVTDLEQILEVPGIDAVYIGPSDLSFSMGGTPTLDQENDKQMGMYRRILELTKARGIHAAIHCGTTDYARRMHKMGFNMITVGSDATFIATGSRAAVAAMRAPH